MKHNKIIFSIAGICIITCYTALMNARPLITVNIKPFAQERKQASQETFKKSIEKPGKVGSILLRYGQPNIPANVGIFATYWGYLGVSDFTGSISFTRHTVKPEIQLLITPFIEPVMMVGTTVHHWVVKQNTPAELYSFKRIQNKDTKKYSWSTQQGAVEYDKPLSLQTIVIFAHPDHIYVPTGDTPTRSDPSLILPPVFAKRSINKVARALRVLTIRHFFSPVRFIDKKVNDTYYIELLKS